MHRFALCLALLCACDADSTPEADTIEEVAPPVLGIADPPSLSLCGGERFEVAYTLPPGLTRRDVLVQLSQADGGFDPTLLSSAPSIRALIELPFDAPAGDAYRLRIRSPSGDATNPTPFRIDPAPTAVFEVSRDEVLAGETVKLTNASEDDTAYGWSFGVGASPATSGARQPPSVSWSNDGTKTVTLTSGNGVCDTVSTREVIVRGCDPVIPEDAAVVAASGESHDDVLWLCSGVSASGHASAVFVEPGATYAPTSASSGVVYLSNGATYRNVAHSRVLLVRGPDAVVVGDAFEGRQLVCDDLVFDRSRPPIGCD